MRGDNGGELLGAIEREVTARLINLILSSIGGDNLNEGADFVGRAGVDSVPRMGFVVGVVVHCLMMF